MAFGILYSAYNKINGKAYIGKTIRGLEKRKKAHLDSAKRGNHNIKFYNALNKYGFDNFIWTVLGEFPINELDKNEKRYIALFDTKNNGYNTTDGGEGLSGYKFSDESKLKMSESQRGPKPFRRKRINMFNYETGELLESFIGILETANVLNIKKSSIDNNLAGRSKKVFINNKIKVFFEYEK